mgnify:CR=1 FL=1
MDKQLFQEHIKHEHKSTYFSEYLEECVYGGTDGIITTFAVVSGFSGANFGAGTLNLSIITVLLFGVANLIADGAAMGFGNYLSIKSKKRFYNINYKKELEETINSKDFEIAETEFIFQNSGFTKKDSKLLTSLISKNPDFWVKFMLLHECNLDNPEHINPVKTGMATFLSFIVFGLIPLLPYFFINQVSFSFYLSIIFTFLALNLLGVFRSLITQNNLFLSISETVFIGSIAASIAYFVGFLFSV